MAFRVTPAVLIPRPETEHVVERAVELARQMESRPEQTREGTPRPTVIDAGTGSGCIAIAVACELPRARVLGTDISGEALAVASGNARRLGARLAGFCRCDLLAAMAGASADLVVCNPPYVPEGQARAVQREIRDFEPHHAVFAGPEGTEVYARLAGEAERVLRPGGWLVVELGFLLAERVRGLFGGRWEAMDIRPDLAGIPRVLSARLRE